MLLEGDQQIILLLCTSSYKMPSEFEKIYTQSYNHIPNKDASCDISNRVFFFVSIYILILCCCDTSPGRYSKCIYLQMKTFFLNMKRLFYLCSNSQNMAVQYALWQGFRGFFLTRKKPIKCISDEINEESFQPNI